jgi:hypothetical protein
MKYRVKVHNLFKNQIGGDPSDRNVEVIRTPSGGVPARGASEMSSNLRISSSDVSLQSKTENDLIIKIYSLERQIYNLDQQSKKQLKVMAKLEQEKNQLSKQLGELETQYKDNIQKIKQKFEVDHCVRDGPAEWGTWHDKNCKLATDHPGSHLKIPKVKEILYSQEEIDKANQKIEEKQEVEDKRLIDFAKEVKKLTPELKLDLKLAQERQRVREQKKAK